MYVLALVFALLNITFYITSALTLPQISNLSPLDLDPLLTLTLPNATTISTSTTSTNDVVCFPPVTRDQPLKETTKGACEKTLDNWMRGKSLIAPRKFSRRATAPGDVRVPIQQESGSCVIYANVLRDTDEDILTLAEVYAELMGPDGVVKRCVRPMRKPGVGGRMILGRIGVLRFIVTGKIDGVVED